MLTRWRFKRICKEAKGPDYTDRFPVLVYLKEQERIKKAALKRKVAICTCIVMALITTLATIIFYHPNVINEPGKETLDNSAINSAEAKESAEISNNTENKYDKIVYGQVKNPLHNQDTIIKKEELLIDQDLKLALSDKKNENNLFAVYITLFDYNSYSDAQQTLATNRLKVLSQYTVFLQKYRLTIKAVILGNAEIEQAIAPIIEKQYEYDLSYYESIGGFDKRFFDIETVNTIYKIFNATTEQLKDLSFLRQLDVELNNAFCGTSLTSSKGGLNTTMWELNAVKSLMADRQWKTDTHISFLENIGIEATSLTAEETISLDVVTNRIYKATLNKEQIEQLNGTSYGVFICLRRVEE